MSTLISPTFSAEYMSYCVVGKPFGGRSRAAKLVISSSVINTPPAWMERWRGKSRMRSAMERMLRPISLCRAKADGLRSICSISPLGKPNTLPSSRQSELSWKVTVAPKSATCSRPYFSKMYAMTLSRSRHEKSRSKSGGLLRIGLRKRSKYKSSSMGSTSVIFKQ